MNQITPLFILKAQSLSKTFYHPIKVNILNNIDLTVQPGDTVAITGRSGEGKSTLLQILGTLETHCKGQLSICDQQVSFFNKNKIRNKHIGFVFQSFHLLEDYTTLENVLMPARIARSQVFKGSEWYERGMTLLTKVGLAHRAQFNTKLLSGGEKQRVAIARAMCNNPDLILADEPSGNLDKQSSIFIHDLLLSFVDEQKKTLIVVTHNKELANLCRDHYELQNGYLRRDES